MKVSRYIILLQELQDKHGDLDVETYSVYGNRIEIKEPKIHFRLILQGQQTKPRFWYEGGDENLKGGKIIYV